ncbi:MAG: hypothetical protein Q7T55_08730 [Solirubrobacteraceae bacterium]|nr:hypothetical protein [Solirubrobacteraceae bacterium]
MQTATSTEQKRDTAFGGDGDTAAGEQAKDALKDAAGQARSAAGDAADGAKEKIADASGQARGRLRDQVDGQSNKVGARAESTASDLRSVSEQLRAQGNEQPAQLADQVADQVEKLGGYLQRSDADRLLHDLEEFGRKRPWAVIAGGLATGFIASRVLKASSGERHARNSTAAAPSPPAGAGYVPPQATPAPYTPPIATRDQPTGSPAPGGSSPLGGSSTLGGSSPLGGSSTVGGSSPLGGSSTTATGASPGVGTPADEGVGTPPINVNRLREEGLGSDGAL